MEACKRIATTSVRDPKRRRPDGKTTFNVSFYAVSKDGKFFGGCIYPGGKMAVHDGDSARVVDVRAALREVSDIGRGATPPEQDQKARRPTTETAAPARTDAGRYL